MFKNLIVYKIEVQAGAALSSVSVEERLAARQFAPCTPTQQVSAGWVPPRGVEHGPMLEVVGGQWILMAKAESKKVPAEVLKRTVDAMAAKVEADTGRKPGKRQRKEMKEEAMLSLLPSAFPRQVTTHVWIDPAAKTLAIDCGSQAKADDIATMLVQALDGLALRLLQTNLSPAAAMSSWLLAGEAPPSFSLDRKLELKSADELKSVVRYSRHAIDIPEVQEHIKNGKEPTSLAMTFSGRVSFTLTDAMQLRGIELDDGLFAKASAEAAVEGFEADVAIMTGELRPTIAALVEALDGELMPERPEA